MTETEPDEARPHAAPPTPDAERADTDTAPPAALPDLRLDALAIGRRLVQSRAHAIGFLAVKRQPDHLATLLAALASAIHELTGYDAGIVGPWQAWDGRAGGTRAPHPHYPGVFTLVPPPCDSVAAANPALQEALMVHGSGNDRILVDLGGYTKPGVLPDAAEYVDGVVLLVEAKRTRAGGVRRLARMLPPRKNLGAILLG